MTRASAASALRRIARRLGFPLRSVRQLRSCSGSHSYVYFVQSGEFVKIGVSRCVRDRVETLESASPLDLRVLLLVPGDVQLERHLHRCFWRSRRRFVVRVTDGRVLRRRCRLCPRESGRKTTHMGTANGVALASGCEWHMAIWRRDG